jgi:hypothetical protein
VFDKKNYWKGESHLRKSINVGKGFSAAGVLEAGMTDEKFQSEELKVWSMDTRTRACNISGDWVLGKTNSADRAAGIFWEAFESEPINSLGALVF